MNRIPFSAYDFFGYLASGFLIIASVDSLGTERVVLQEDLSAVLSIFWIGMAYIIGQILASPSAWLLERTLVGKYMERPNINLFKNKPEKGWVKLFPGYFTPLPIATQRRILEKAKAEGINEKGEALFVHVFGKIKADKDTMVRLSIFLNMYGFCRNISFSCLLSGLVMLVGFLWTRNLDLLLWTFAALVGSVGMFYRYLKFFRQYSYELLVTYAA
jgi:hypothetical protein